MFNWFKSEKAEIEKLKEKLLGVSRDAITFREAYRDSCELLYSIIKTQKLEVTKSRDMEKAEEALREYQRVEEGRHGC